jgi:glucokinase
VVLGGGVSTAGTALTDPLQRALETRLPWRAVPAIEVTHLGTEAGTLGAALLGLRAAGREPDVDPWVASALAPGDPGATERWRGHPLERHTTSLSP